MQEPFTYLSLIAVLQEHHDLVRAIHPTLWHAGVHDEFSWRGAVRWNVVGIGGPSLTETYAILWSCYFHTATDEEIDAHVQRVFLRGHTPPPKRRGIVRTYPDIVRIFFTPLTGNILQAGKAEFEALLRLPVGTNGDEL